MYINSLMYLLIFRAERNNYQLFLLLRKFIYSITQHSQQIQKTQQIFICKKNIFNLNNVQKYPNLIIFNKFIKNIIFKKKLSTIIIINVEKLLNLIIKILLIK